MKVVTPSKRKSTGSDVLLNNLGNLQVLTKESLPAQMSKGPSESQFEDISNTLPNKDLPMSQIATADISDPNARSHDRNLIQPDDTPPANHPDVANKNERLGDLIDTLQTPTVRRDTTGQQNP
ncbi:hypothetical protein HK098_002468 [Nowakowskiella sp. JEL0407]|nr:hypothetical protein HK098_002468 [Nowakowskiella sp. JEL0407]